MIVCLTFSGNLLLDGGLPEVLGRPDQVVQLGLLLFQLAKDILQIKKKGNRLKNIPTFKLYKYLTTIWI